MSKEYIEREIVLAITEDFLFANTNKLGYPPNKAPIYHMLKTLAAADVAPVVHGEWSVVWVDQGHIDMEKMYKCSVCGSRKYNDYRYCPNCGAIMDGGNK